MVISRATFAAAAAAGLFFIAHTSGQAPATATAPISYSHQIRPVLELRCFECHDHDQAESDLDLTTRAGLMAGGKKAGPSVVAGRPDASPLMEYLAGTRHPRMPKGRRPLTDEQMALVSAWIAGGALDDGLQVGSGDSTSALATAGVPSLMPSHTTGPEPSGGDAEAQFVARRNARVERLPRPAAPDGQYTSSTNPVDQFVTIAWAAAGLPEAHQPPPLVDDAGFIRRVSLDVTGVVPTGEQTRRFVDDRSPQKRDVLVDTLLARHADYAAHWTPFWEEALGSQTTELQGGIPTRGNYRDWIYAQLAANTPYDVFAASLIDPSLPRHKPRVDVVANEKHSTIGYILNDTQTDTIQSAANVAQVFLGTSMKCASCHNHFLNDEWPQTRFLAFAGLFATHDLEVIRCERKTGQIVPAQFPFTLPEVPTDAPADLDARLHRAALLLTDPTNPRFARAIVNRLWRQYLGLGLVEPADDFRLERAPSNPALLDWLADDFMRNGYDLAHTTRLILTSHTYQSQYDPRLEDRLDVQKPDLPRYYRSPRLRRLTAEEFIDSARLVTTGALDLEQRVFQHRESTALTRALGRPAARNEISTGRSEDAAVLQALELMNGPELSTLAYGAPLAARLAPDGVPDNAEAGRIAETLYQRILGRPASQDDVASLRSFLQDALKNPGRTVVGPARDEQVFGDTLPAGAVLDDSNGTDAASWAARLKPMHGRLAYSSTTDATVRVSKLPPLALAPRDRLVTWVYLDPEHPPAEIAVGWLTGDREHRAYWSTGDRPAGAGDAPERRWLGPLPKIGRWVRLEVPAGAVDVASDTPVTGWSFGQTGGTASWSGAAVARHPALAGQNAIGDVLWVLLSSPEFQFIR